MACRRAAMPVEITLLPNGSRSTCYELVVMGAIGTLFALMLLQAAKPVVPVDWRDGVLELYIQPPHFTKFKEAARPNAFSLRNVLRAADKLLRGYERTSSVAVARARYAPRREWLLEHQDANGSWGGIQPCYLLSTMALKASAIATTIR